MVIFLINFVDIVWPQNYYFIGKTVKGTILSYTDLHFKIVNIWSVI